MHRAALEGVVEIFAVGGRAVDERRSDGAERAPMADRGARAVVIASSKRARDIIEAARGQAEADHVDRQVLAFGPYRSRQPSRIDGRDALGKLVGNRDSRKRLVHGRFWIASPWRGTSLPRT